MKRSFSIKLHSETQVSSRLGMSGGGSPRHAQNPLSGERRKPLSITHHDLSPPPSHHHLYISSIDYNVFIVLQCHLKDFCAEKCRKAIIYYYYYLQLLLFYVFYHGTEPLDVVPLSLPYRTDDGGFQARHYSGGSHSHYHI